MAMARLMGRGRRLRHCIISSSSSLSATLLLLSCYSSCLFYLFSDQRQQQQQGVASAFVLNTPSYSSRIQLQQQTTSGRVMGTGHVNVLDGSRQKKLQPHYCKRPFNGFSRYHNHCRHSTVMASSSSTAATDTSLSSSTSSSSLIDVIADRTDSGDSSGVVVSERFIFFGGKGGVGKTSVSAATAVKSADTGYNTLVISTDPAHSLGDALDQDVGGGKPVRVQGLDNLWAMEVDAEEAIKEFEMTMATFDLKAMAAESGIPADMISNLGLDELGSVMANPPPGLDELVALAGVVKLTKANRDGDSSAVKFDRIIIDTAPTGHTLRLLAFPDFLDSFLEKVIKLRGRMGGLLNLVTTFTGGKGNIVDKLDKAVEKMQSFKEEMIALQKLFRNPARTEFCVVTIPTQLALAESKRLLASLSTQGIAVRHVVVNQYIKPDATQDYLNRMSKGQEECLKRLRLLQGSEGGGGGGGDDDDLASLSITEVPYFDMEVTGVYPLSYMGKVAFKGANEAAWHELLTAQERKFVILGGKGGVGKTSTSSALAVTCANEGYDTVVVSTDPAHSLGDALQMDLTSGKLVQVPGLAGSGRLFALEVDTEGAIGEFKGLVDTFLKAAKTKAAAKGTGVGGGGDGGGDMLSQLNLEDFASVLDNAPPGTDEIVALSKVLNLVRGKNEINLSFDRIVIDTAPTGHTLRMLSYPEFLDEFFDKLIRIRNKFKGATALLNMFSGGGGGGGGGGNAAGSAGGLVDEAFEEEQRDRLRDFQFKMMELQDLFRDKEQSEFVVVTIPSILAVAESERLVKSLREQEVPVKHMVVNRIVSADVQEGYIGRLTRGQAEGMKSLEEVCRSFDVGLTKVPFFDVEVRNIYGLRAMAAVLFKE